MSIAPEGIKFTSISAVLGKVRVIAASGIIHNVAIFSPLQGHIAQVTQVNCTYVVTVLYVGKGDIKIGHHT